MLESFASYFFQKISFDCIKLQILLCACINTMHAWNKKVVISIFLRELIKGFDVKFFYITCWICIISSFSWHNVQFPNYRIIVVKMSIWEANNKYLNQSFVMYIALRYNNTNVFKFYVMVKRLWSIAIIYPKFPVKRLHYG